MLKRTPVTNRGFVSGGLRISLEICASIQVLCRLPIFRAKSRPKANPENISINRQTK